MLGLGSQEGSTEGGTRGSGIGCSRYKQGREGLWSPPPQRRCFVPGSPKSLPVKSKPYSAAPASSPKCKFSGQTILMCADIPQGTGGVGNLPEIGSSYFCLKLAFHLTFNYQAQNVFLAAGIRRMLSLLFQPDFKVVFMGRLGRVCACSCPKSGKEEQGEAWQVSLDPQNKRNPC